MEHQHTKFTAAPYPASSGSSSRSIHGSSMSSAFLGVSSSAHSESQRRSSPWLYPYPPPAPLPGHIASRGSAAAFGVSASSGSSSSSSQFHQISPSPGTAAKRRPRPNTRITHSLPSPFLSELSEIRRMSANLFGDLNAQEMSQRRPLLHGQQDQEMTPSSSSLTSPAHHTSIPIGDFSGFLSAPPPSQQQQAQPSFSSLQPLPGGNFSGFPLPESQPQHMQPSSTTDLPSTTFSGFQPPAASQHLSTYLAPLPSWSTIFQSSSWCHAQPQSQPQPPSSGDSVDLPPFPQFGLPQNNGSSSTESSSSTGFVQPSSKEMYDLAPFPENLQMPPLQLQQVKKEPVAVAPWLEPEIISLDDDGDELSDVLHSFTSSHGHGSAASFPNPMHDQPTNLEVEGMQGLQLGGSGSELNMKGAAEGVGVGQTCEAMPTPASVHDKVNDNGSGSSSSSIPWNGHGFLPMYSLSEEQAIRQLSNLLSRWSDTASSTSDQSMPALANKFDMMNIGGGSSSAGAQMPWNNGSLSVQNSTPILGMDRPGLPPRPPARGAGASSSMSRRGGTKEHYYFSEAEMETVNEDNRLTELMKTDSKRVKRILRNRVYVARAKEQKANHNQDLQCRVDALNMECMSLSAEVQSRQEMVDKLRTENREVQLKLNGLKELEKLKQALNDQLQSELQRLEHHELNVRANGIHNSKSSQTMAGWNASSINGSNN